MYTMLNISSTRTSMTYFYKHLIFCFASFGFMFIAFRLPNLEKIRNMSFFFNVMIIISLILVLFIGIKVNGARRFFRIGPLNVQPSLFARITLVMYFAHILDKKKDVIESSSPIEFIKNFKPLIVLPLITMGLIFAEKHLSALIISGLTLLSMMWIGKIHILTILVIVAILLVGLIVVINSGDEFRSVRIKIFKEYSVLLKLLGFSEKAEIEGGKVDDYQIKESLTALSSGRIVGTGSEKGRGKHYYLPEAKTDYVFSVIGEEFGFLGAIVVLGLYVTLFIRALISSWRSESMFLRLFGMGLALNIFINAMVNIGVAISAIPSTGVTLPFISYGGMSLLVNSISIGLLLNISSKRREVW